MGRRWASFFAKYQLVSVVLLLLIAWILWQVRDIVLLLFLSYILAIALLPLTAFLGRHNIPKIFGVVGILVVIGGGIVILVIAFSPVVVSQTQLFLKSSPFYLAQLGKWVNVHVDAPALQSFITSRIGEIYSNVIEAITNTFAVFFTFTTFLIITFYLIMDHERIQITLLKLFPQSARASITASLGDINKTLGNWVWGQFVLSCFVGLLSGFVYFLAGLPFALPLAVFAGVMEVVPTIGPVIAFIPAVLVGFLISPLTGLIVAGGYVAIQMLEGNILVPKIMQHSIGLHPLAVILAILLGARFFGFLGTLLSVPIVAVITVVYNRFVQKD